MTGSIKIIFRLHFLKLTQKQILMYSGLVQVCSVFLHLAKFFVTDCRYKRDFFRIVQEYPPVSIFQLSNATVITAKTFHGLSESDFFF